MRTPSLHVKSVDRQQYEIAWKQAVTLIANISEGQLDIDKTMKCLVNWFVLKRKECRGASPNMLIPTFILEKLGRFDYMNRWQLVISHLEVVSDYEIDGSAIIEKFGKFYDFVQENKE